LLEKTPIIRFSIKNKDKRLRSFVKQDRCGSAMQVPGKTRCCFDRTEIRGWKNFGKNLGCNCQGHIQAHEMRFAGIKMIGLFDFILKLIIHFSICVNRLLFCLRYCYKNYQKKDLKNKKINFPKLSKAFQLVT
jgi:hypothetical protein